MSASIATDTGYTARAEINDDSDFGVTSLYPPFLKAEVNDLHDPSAAVYGYADSSGIPAFLVYAKA